MVYNAFGKNEVATLEISFQLKRAMAVPTEPNEGRILGMDNRQKHGKRKANNALKNILGKVSSESVLHAMLQLNQLLVCSSGIKLN